MANGDNGSKLNIGVILVYCVLTSIAAWAGALGASSTFNNIAPIAITECQPTAKGIGE